MAGLPNSSNALQQWHHLFEAQGGPRTPEASQHLQQLLRLGLPTRKHEDWKYTPLDALLNGRFVAEEGASLSAEQRDALALPLDAYEERLRLAREAVKADSKRVAQVVRGWVAND